MEQKAKALRLEKVALGLPPSGECVGTPVGLGVDLTPARTGRLSIEAVSDFFGAARAVQLIRDNGLLNVEGKLPASISDVEFWQLCNDNINRHNDEGHGCTKRPLPMSSWCMIFAAVNQMDNVGLGLKKFAELTPLIPAGIEVTLGHSHSSVYVNYSLDKFTPVSTRSERYVELMSLVFHCTLLWGTARPINPSRIRLSNFLHEKDGSLLSCLSNERTRHGSGVTVAYDRQDMAIPLGVRKHQHHSRHETATFLEIAANIHRNSQRRRSEVVEALRPLLAATIVSQHEASEILGMSIATLQRRLAQAGTTFREVSMEVRREKLRSLLATTDSLDDIASEIGFSDRRSLWRACQEWLGMSPNAYRKTRVQGH